MSDPRTAAADVLPGVNGLMPAYRVGDVGIFVAGSGTRWKRRVEYTLSRQLGGLEPEDARGLRQRLIFADSAVLTRGTQGRERIATDARMGLSLLEHHDSLYVWCADWTALSLTFLLELLLVAQGRTFCHAAALSDHDRGMLIVGPSRSGKTGAAIALMKETAYKLLGDDFVVLDRGGHALAYPTPLTIYAHHRTLLADSGRTVQTRIVSDSPLWRGIRRIMARLDKEAMLERWVSPGYALVRVRDLYPDSRILKGEVRVSSVYVLTPSTAQTRITTRSATADETTTLLFDGTQGDWSQMTPLLRTFLAGRGTTVEAYLGRLKDLMRQALRHADQFVIVETPVGAPAADMARSIARIVSGK